jgi:hypothetical protein
MKRIFITLSVMLMAVMVMAQAPAYAPNEQGSEYTGGEIDGFMVACDNEKGYYDFPFEENGITVTGTGTGSYTVYTPGWGSCGIFAAANCVWIGSGGPGTFTNTFSSPVNDMIYNITASDPGEVITITTDGGTPTITYTDGTCPGGMAITGNVISCTQSNGGGRFLVTAPSDFTTITFSQTGGQNGSTMTMCFDQAVAPPTTPVSPWAIGLGIFLILAFTVFRIRRS